MQKILFPLWIRRIIGWWVQFKIIRFIISGGTSATVLLGTVYVLKEDIGMWYIHASTIGFIISVFINFSLQKLWVFKNTNHEESVKQIVHFFMVATFNLGLNTLIMYALVSKFLIWYMFAQVCSALIIACWSFFIYKKIFKEDIV
jgi:dolichol-phosphate mannosyltransferase